MTPFPGHVRLERRDSVTVAACLHGSAVLLLLLAPAQLLLREPIWSLPRSLLPQAIGFALLYLLSLLVMRLQASWQKLLPPSRAFIAAAGLSGYYLSLHLFVPEPSSALMLGGSLLYILLWFAPVVLRRRRAIMAATLAGSALLLLVLGAARPPAVDLDGNVRERTIHTALHTLRVSYYADLIPYTSRWGGLRGGIDHLGHSYVAVTGDGDFFRLRWTGDSLSVDSLRIRAPLNRGEFQRDVAQLGVSLRDVWFDVPGIVIQERGDSAQIVVAHSYWKSEQSCFVLRLSSLLTAEEDLWRGSEPPPWTMLHETRPCLPLKERGHPFAGHQAGGRLALHGDTAVILTVGDYEFDGLAADESLPQSAGNDYGKTMLICLDGSCASIVSIGHRNPQGVIVDGGGEIWVTEHGPSGGDELNAIQQGGNYGWPIHTYGAQYGDLTWTPPPRTSETDQLREPVFAWVPSIGISNLIALQNPLFPQWRGDLLIAALRDNSLQRVRLVDGRAVYVEPIPIGQRIRDLVEGVDGRIVLWTDEGTIVSLNSAEGEEGATLFQRCAGCHSLDGSSSIGPDIREVIGRPIASAPGFAYSLALRQAGGVWTSERLDAFLESPTTFAPGTSMAVDGIADPWVRRRLIEYLGSTDVRPPK